MPAASGNNEKDSDLVIFDFNNKDLLHFLKTSFKDKNDYKSISLKYDLLEENNFQVNYPSLYIYPFNNQEHTYHDGSNREYINNSNNLKKGEYVLTGVNIYSDYYSSGSSFSLGTYTFLSSVNILDV